ncbi:ABC transporter ATP-binding protein [Halogeometricum sp. S1BR25-6]|uniref:ABC transporter ATP-binding protein n=1 Tax=Halogeometricum salsisoli TaxID=2950536 RepID=A0ABU2GHN4_9EURY|nr:ABC transporter ATP-binding protein [Halogeometricum sp. S1BR25-6]
MSERPASVNDPIFELRDTNVTFSMNRGTSRVLNDVTFDVRREEILGVVGESGSGKSMFASSLLDAVVEPGTLSGEVRYRSDTGDQVNLLNLSKEELRRLRWEEISMVFQGAQSSFNPTMRIREHFELVLEAHDKPVDEGISHARDLISDLYMDPDRVLDSYPHELSGGMQQRALIAYSLILKPNVLVMDEPTAALDLLMQQSILSLLEDLQETYDLTVIFITHDLPLVAGLADRLAVMYAFEFIEFGPADEVLENPTHPYTRALLRSVPNLDAPLGEMSPIEGSAPDPVNIPDGCTYHPRCPLADEQCVREDPDFHEVGDEHGTACFHWEEAEEAIPFANADEYGRQELTEGSQSEEPVVSMNDVEVHFEDGGGILNIFSESDTVYAVDGIDLDIYENDVVALVGESGCGKTTLGKTSIGVQRPTGGSVEYRDQNVWDARDGTGQVEIPFEEIRRSLQIVHQDPGSSLNPNRKVLTTLESPLKRWNQKMGTDERHQRIHALLDIVGMTPPEDYAQRYPHQLSGGEKQRVALIRALLMNPDLILADEAVSALDVSLRVEMMDLMLELQNLFDTSYLFISHDLANARYLAGNAGGRIGVMYLGQIIEIGTVEEILRNPQHPYTKVLMWATADLDSGGENEEPPIRGIDIPDAKNPPSGCRFHTRCPEAREVCTEREPEQFDSAEGHSTACFRVCDDDHPYWESDPLPGVQEDQ